MLGTFQSKSFIIKCKLNAFDSCSELFSVPRGGKKRFKKSPILIQALPLLIIKWTFSNFVNLSKLYNEFFWHNLLPPIVISVVISIWHSSSSILTAKLWFLRYRSFSNRLCRLIQQMHLHSAIQFPFSSSNIKLWFHFPSECSNRNQHCWHPNLAIMNC